MPVRASRRAGVEVPYDVQYAIASDPAAFDAKVQEWDRRRNAAVEAEALAAKAEAQAKAERDVLAKDRAEFNTYHAKTSERLDADRREFENRAKAETARLLKLEGELVDRGGALDARERAAEDREAAANKAFREAAEAKQAADNAKRLAETNASIATDLRAKAETKLERIRQIGVEMQA